MIFIINLNKNQFAIKFDIGNNKDLKSVYTLHGIYNK